MSFDSRGNVRSALVGFATMVILGPLPGVLMQKIQTVQMERMKRTDARIQTVTESGCSH